MNNLLEVHNVKIERTRANIQECRELLKQYEAELEDLEAAKKRAPRDWTENPYIITEGWRIGISEVEKLEAENVERAKEGQEPKIRAYTRNDQYPVYEWPEGSGEMALEYGQVIYFTHPSLRPKTKLYLGVVYYRDHLSYDFPRTRYLTMKAVDKIASAASSVIYAMLNLSTLDTARNHPDRLLALFPAVEDWPHTLEGQMELLSLAGPDREE